jgi:oxygen-independent coproporphyrinogen-3 oxidase
MQTALYIHFPFCLKKCLYCDFNSLAGSPLKAEEYVAGLLREMALRAGELSEPACAPTLYFGGGTPSLMDPTLVGRIIDSAAKLYHLDNDAEITLEANPGTLTRERLAGYRSAGVNRLSLGVQSFDDRQLGLLGRVHSAGQALAAYALARDAGFSNISIDLIHSLPGESADMWGAELRKTLALQPEHISAYALTLEEGTPLADQAAAGTVALPAENEAVRQFELTTELLQASGYEQYEISNFARPGFRARHNQVYWRRASYLGFGAGAHSFLCEAPHGVRWKNPDLPERYLAPLAHWALPEEEMHQLSRREAISEWLFLGLRMLEGVELAQFDNEFGGAVTDLFANELATLTGQGLLLMEGGRLRLSPAALIVSNQVFLRFI